MTRPTPPPAKFQEHRLAHDLLDGLHGLEIGAATHNPFGLNTLNIAPLQDYERYAVESRTRWLMVPTPVAAFALGDRLPFAAQSQDFILSSHVVEHLPDVIGTFCEWQRVVRDGGYVFMIIPLKGALPEDAPREFTTLTHFIEDYKTHATLHTHSSNDVPLGAMGHYHTFHPDSVLEIIEWMRAQNLGNWELVAREEIDTKVGNGFTLAFQIKHTLHSRSLTPLHKRHLHDTLVVAAFTPYPWRSVLPTLRFTQAAQWADFRVLQGNEGQKIFPQALEQAEVILLQRHFAIYPELYQQVVQTARRLGKTLILDLDDLLFEVPVNHPEQNELASTLIPVLRATLDCDGITTSTPALAHYLQALNPQTFLLPNYLNDYLWKFREPLIPAPNQPVTLGYVGTTTHTPDLEMIAPILSELLNTYGQQIAIKFWGAPPPSQLSTHPQVTHYPIQFAIYQEFANFFNTLECDIFLAPLVNNVFNRHKSPIKFLEYSTLAIPGVYSRLAPYTAVVQHRQNGFLADTLVEWAFYLKELIHNPALRRELGTQAQQTVRANWLLSRHAHHWLETYQKVKPMPHSTSLSATLAQITQQTLVTQTIITELNYKLQTAAEQIEQLNQQLAQAQTELSNSHTYLQTLQRTKIFRLAERYWQWRGKM